MFKKTRQHLIFFQFLKIFKLINIVNNSFVTRIRTTRFLEQKLILFYIQEPIDVFRQLFFLRMQLFTLYVLEFFQVASAIELHKKSIGLFHIAKIRLSKSGNACVLQLYSVYMAKAIRNLSVFNKKKSSIFNSEYFFKRITQCSR